MVVDEDESVLRVDHAPSRVVQIRYVPQRACAVADLAAVAELGDSADVDVFPSGYFAVLAHVDHLTRAAINDK